MYLTQSHHHLEFVSTLWPWITLCLFSIEYENPLTQRRLEKAKYELWLRNRPRNIVEIGPQSLLIFRPSGISHLLKHIINGSVLMLSCLLFFIWEERIRDHMLREYNLSLYHRKATSLMDV